MFLMKRSRVGDSEVSLDVARSGFEDFEVKMTVEQAQAMAVDILAAHPLDRCERMTLPDWKADASRYLKDPNMLTRRFARQVVALVDGFEVAQMQLAVAAAVQSELVNPRKERCMDCHGRGYQCTVCKAPANEKGECLKCGGKGE